MKKLLLFLLYGFLICGCTPKPAISSLEYETINLYLDIFPDTSGYASPYIHRLKIPFDFKVTEIFAYNQYITVQDSDIVLIAQIDNTPITGGEIKLLEGGIKNSLFIARPTGLNEGKENSAFNIVIFNSESTGTAKINYQIILQRL